MCQYGAELFAIEVYVLKIQFFLLYFLYLYNTKLSYFLSNVFLSAIYQLTLLQRGFKMIFTLSGISQKKIEKKMLVDPQGPPITPK